MLSGAGMLVSLLSFLILLSAFASNRVDDGISLRLGLDRQASGIMTTCSRPHRPRRTAPMRPACSPSPPARSRWPAHSSRSTRSLPPRTPRPAQAVPVADLARRAVSYGGARHPGRAAGPQRLRPCRAGRARHLRHLDAVLLVDDALPAGRPGPMAQAATFRDLDGSLLCRPGMFSKCRRHVNTDPGVAPGGQNSAAVDIEALFLLNHQL